MNKIKNYQETLVNIERFLRERLNETKNLEEIFRDYKIYNKDHNYNSLYRISKLLKIMNKTSNWKKEWISEILKIRESYETSINFPLKIIKEAEPVINEKKGHLVVQDFSSYIFNRVPIICKELGLEDYWRKNKELDYRISTYCAFEQLNTKKGVDRDYDLSSTFFIEENICLSPHATPHYFSKGIKNMVGVFKAYRREKVDKTHLCEFHQLEYNREVTPSEDKDYTLLIQQLIDDFIKIYRILGIKETIEVRPTRNNYTYPSFEYYAIRGDKAVELGNSGIMSHQVYQAANNKAYKKDKIYLAGGIGLERVYALVNNLSTLSELKVDFR